jgi:ubiquitin C-terminal hydrolase
VGVVGCHTATITNGHFSSSMMKSDYEGWHDQEFCANVPVKGAYEGLRLVTFFVARGGGNGRGFSQ